MDIDAEPGASVFLIVSGRAAPLVVNGTIAAIQNGRLVVDLEDVAGKPAPEPAEVNTSGRPNFSRRLVPRYPTWLDATVFSESYPEGRAAVITDLSVLGACVEIDEWHGETFYRLMAEINGETFQVECECVHQESAWRGVLLHTRFLLLTREQSDFLGGVVAGLRNSFGEAQEELVHDRNGTLLA